MTINTAGRIAVVVSIGLVMLVPAHISRGGASSAGAKGVREIAEAVAEQVGKKGSREFLEQTTKELAEVSAKYGDEGLEVIDQYGVAALRTLRNAGEEGGEYLPKAISRYGSDAIRLAESSAGRQVLREGNEAVIKAVAKHTESALPMIREVGETAARALDNVDAKNGRRLIQIYGERRFSEADFDQIITLIGKYGDRMCEFITKHQDILLKGGGLAILAANAERIVDGTFDLAKELGKQSGDVAKHAIDKVNLNLWIGVSLCLVSISWLLKRRMRQARSNERPNSKGVEK